MTAQVTGDMSSAAHQRYSPCEVSTRTSVTGGIVYRAPDFESALDVAAHRDLAPVDGRVKGMFFEDIATQTKVIAGQRLDSTRYIPFRGYPLRLWLDHLARSARFAYPNLPVREGLRQLGRSMFPTFYASMVGKVIFSVAGGDLHRSLELYPKLWSVISDHASAEVAELTSRRVVIRQRNVWDFTDSFQIGSLEGGFSVFGQRASVRIATLSPCDADFEITW